MKKANKLFALLMLVVLVSPVFNSCKKGANDPFISLRSRAGRLKGVWNLTAGTVTNISGSSSTTYTYTGTMVTYVAGGQSQTAPYTESVEFVKDNTFTSTVMSGTTMEVVSGFWAFMDGYDAVKNKECVVLRIKSEMYGSDITTYTDDLMPSQILRFDELKGSECIIMSNGTETSSGTVSNYTSTKTYTKK